MKKIIYSILLLFLFLSGCAVEETPDIVETPAIVTAEQPMDADPKPTFTPDASLKPSAQIAPTPEPVPTQQAVPTPSLTLTPSPTVSPAVEPISDEYFIDGLSIFRRSGAENILVYKVKPYFPSDWNCYLSKLMVHEGNVYFTEGGMPGDDYSESLHRIVRLDSMGRSVLYESQVCGYDQLVAFGNKIFFVIGEFDSVQIGWAEQDASDGGLLNFTDYAAVYGIESVYNNAELYEKDGKLYAVIDFYTSQNWPDDIGSHKVQIGDDLSITRIEDV